jgi:hypothetical protein
VLGVNIISKLSHQAVNGVINAQVSVCDDILYCAPVHILTVKLPAVLVNLTAILYFAQFTVATCCLSVAVQLVCTAQLAPVVRPVHTVQLVSLVSSGLVIRFVPNISNVPVLHNVITSILSLNTQYILLPSFIQFKYHKLESDLLNKPPQPLPAEKNSDGLPTKL